VAGRAPDRIEVPPGGSRPLYVWQF
jgi:hypothetical protein